MANDLELGVHPKDRELIPRILVRAVITLCLSVLAIVSYARLTDRPLVATPPSLEETPIVHEMVIQIYSQPDGAVWITDVDGTELLNLGPGEGGYAASIYRVLDRQRGARGVAASDPIRLARHSDGRVSLIDDLSDVRIEFIGAGAAQVAQFSGLLEE